ncbi:MAG: Gfo/Idh/MocA family protein [Anaerolineae bacterium]
MKDVTVAMVGLGGYGNFYLSHVFADYEDQTFRLLAGIDPDPVGCRQLEQFETYGIPIYPDLETFYGALKHVDLVIIAAPIHLHAPFTCTALAHGSNVLCEKPVAPTVQDVETMAEAEARSDGFVAIGYQWSYADAIQSLKQDVISGELGRPVRLVTKALWPRPLSYYGRNTWAGRLKADNGSWVLDSPANNATAHYLHNCFYVLGDTIETSARPVDVEAELYRANDIENYDTAAIRCHTERDVEILFFTAHPVPERIGPTLRYEFEQAVVEFDAGDNRLMAVFEGERVKDYGDPDADEANKLWQSIDATRTGGRPACGIEAAASHTLCINGAQESPPEVLDLPEGSIRRMTEGVETLVWVEGLQETLNQCYEDAKMPSSYPSVAWARSGRRLDLRAYDRFPSFG